MTEHVDNTLPRTAQDLNQICACRTLDKDRLRQQLEIEHSLFSLNQNIAETRPHLFSATSVFISPQQLLAMKEIIQAVNAVVQLPAYKNRVLEDAPLIAQKEQQSRGVFMGFDFHLSEKGPQLIEINTNAGGAFLNSALARAQQVCCKEMQWDIDEKAQAIEKEHLFFDMFMHEWKLQCGNKPLRRIAIVDENPEQQYLFPEFQLFEKMCSRLGVESIIVDAKLLEWRSGKLLFNGLEIDMVYNRLTDFYLEDKHFTALRNAYVSGEVVVTPNPHHHALYANKRNLILMSNKDSLEALGVSKEIQKVLLAGIPCTQLVTLENAEQLWAKRRELFFKPAFGYGSKAAYRGDKLTRRVWEEILQGDYVAQVIALPSERLVTVDTKQTELKLDIRAYVYIDEIQLLAARLYSGQTTNFRTLGGGFAPVFVV